MQRFSDFEGQFDDTPDEDEFRKLCSERANSSSCAGISFETSPIKWPGEAEKTSEKASEPPSVVASTYPQQTNGNQAFLEQEEGDGEWVWPTVPPLGETEVVTQTGHRPENNWVDETAPDFSHLGNKAGHDRWDCSHHQVCRLLHVGFPFRFPGVSHPTYVEPILLLNLKSMFSDMAPPKEDDMWADFSSFPTISPTAAANSASSSSSDAWPGSDIHLQGEASDWPLNNSHESKASDPVMVGLAASISHPGDSSEA